jgi:NTE family protein
MTLPFPQLGLVCSGGGARGAAHLGFFDRLADAGIGPRHFACVSGTSSGALALFLYCSGWGTKDAIALARRELTGSSWLSCSGAARAWHMWRLLSGTLEIKLRRHFANARLEALRPRLLIVSFDVLRCCPHVHHRGDAVNALLASMAVPGLARAAVVDGRLLVDGGLAANLPAQTLRDVSAVQQVIGVDVSVSRARGTIRRRRGTFQSMLRILDAQQRRQYRQQRALCDVLVEPQVSDVAFGDFSRRTFDRLIDAGRAAADVALPAIARLLSARQPGLVADRCPRVSTLLCTEECALWPAAS